MSCLFCEIVNGNINSERIFENDKFIVIKDISPVAPVHLLIIAKQHLENAEGLENEPEIASGVFSVAKQVASLQGMTDGYRLITNKGDHGGQSVNHLHFHLLGGKALEWHKL